mmetsp:Transcript_21836/g.10250  ORF Transcript_21836/g.10250 Transcript_21836/m.10250 type:complete len:200 (+) Transcript_21836:265-864(+)
MASQFGSSYCPEFPGLQGSGHFEPLFKNSQLGDKLLAGSNPLHPKPRAVPSCAAIVGEAKKVKRLWPCPSFCSILDGKSAKLHHLGLGRFYLKAKLSQSLPQFSPKSLCVCLVLEADNKIVGITDKAGITGTALSVDPFKPEVKGIVQIYVRQQRRDNTTLRGTIVAYRYTPIFCHPCLKNTLHHALNSFVLNPMCQKL